MGEKWRSALKIGHYLLLAAIIAYLVFRLTQIGWEEIGGALPTNPLFYILSLAIFLVLPVSEVANYRLLFGRYVPRGLRVFARKRVYNDALISYSGEAYLYGKLAEMPGVEKKAALVAIKDNSLVSALVSNSWTILLVAAVVAVGRGDILDAILALEPLLVASFAVLCVVIYVLVLFFFRRISTLSGTKLAKIASVHGIKVLLVAGLQALQWSLAIPAAAASTWLLFLAVQTLLKRIPGLPNADLLFLGAGVSLAGFTTSSTAAITAMLVAATATTQLIQLAVFVGTSSMGKPGTGLPEENI